MAALEFALALAAQGYAVFPCRHDKSPNCPHGFDDACRDEAAVCALFARYPGPLIGIATGAISGIDVLDFDMKPQAFDWWTRHHARLPATYGYETRSGGLHLWFRHAAGLRNSAARLARGVDVRAEGGYAIHWPSAGGRMFCDAQPAPWPAWLLDKLNAPHKSPLPASVGVPEQVPGHGGAYAIGALRKAVQRVATAAEGQRNDTLNAECFSLARFVPTGSLAARDIARALAVAALHAGLSGREVERTLASALAARSAS